ncbi:hypothetical protein D9615_008260 [Tricholomella constricta]|uniref:C2H2-type domain-containing protein n=1 Tax=Tricholomella constricta TaxID=117010 RepID=A0A8H5M024_9AGAR|nr:hypothetical protein D9615_008260 [Tricholomella constricta]
MATSQPIALPASNPDNNDYTMGSYSGSAGGPFNPASYTRHFLGSPISWRAGSFGARFPQGSPSAQLFSALDHPKNSSSIDEVSVMNAFNVFDREGELCRNYNCCGIHLPDLHALLEHFEEVHVLVVDPTAPAQITVPFNPQPIDVANHHSHPQSHPTFDTDDMELELDLDNSTHPAPPPHPSSTRSSPSSAGPSPPHTPSTQSLAQFAHQYGQFQHHSPFTSATTSPYTSQPPSPGSSASNPPNPTGPVHSHLQSVGVHFPNAGPGMPAVLAHPEEAFNAYARFAADYSSHMPGTQFNASGGEEIVVNGVGVGEYGAYVGQMPTGVAPVGGQQAQGQQCIPPALLFASTSSSGVNNAREARNASRVASPTAAPPANNKLKLKVRGGLAAHSSSTPNTPLSTTPSTLTPFSANSSLSASTTATSTPASTPGPTPSQTPLPPTTSLLLSKPFRCPKPNCNKSYKQANGLKYHMTHGSCNFAPPKDLEHVKDLLERKRREREANAAGLSRSASLSALSGSRSHPPLTHAHSASGEPFLQNLTHSAYGDLGSITETELREVEREAEKRVRPFACGVGDCQRRYKNMNGLRYHYQHSGDHGAVGLALLAGGLHECLGNNANGEGKGKGKTLGGGVGGEEREGRKRVGAGSGVHRSAASSVRGGSVSVPVSRAGSVSRVATPVPPPPPLGKTQTQGYGSGATTPFTPGYTNPAAAGAMGTVPGGGSGDVQTTATATTTTTPPLTPLTAAVQGLGLGPAVGIMGGVRSQPHSPTHHGQNTFQAQQQHSQSQSPSPHLQQAQAQAQAQQLAYQAQFVELQRRQYMQAQAQAQAQHQAMQAQPHQQQQPQVHPTQQQQQQQHQFEQHFQQQLATQQQQFLGHPRQGLAQAPVELAPADAQAQQEFVEAQRREFELQQQQHQQQHHHRGDVAMT